MQKCAQHVHCILCIMCITMCKEKCINTGRFYLTINQMECKFTIRYLNAEKVREVKEISRFKSR